MTIFLMVIIIAMCILGFIRGFVKTAIPLVSAFCSFILSLMMREWLFGFLFQWAIFSDGHILARVMVIILLFLLLTIAFRLLFFATKLATKFPVIHGIDKILGVLLGFVEGNFIVWSILYLVSLKNGVLFDVQFVEAIQENSYLIFMYHHNLVEILVSNFIF